MATAYTRGDSLGIYETLNDSLVGALGGSRSANSISGYSFITESPIPQIVILAIGGTNGAGAGLLTADSDSSLAWTPPGGTAGASVTISPNQTVLLEGDTASKWIRVHWDGDYSQNDLGGADAITLIPTGEPETANTPANRYRANMICNHSALAQDITSIKIWIGTLGTQRLSGTAQLGASGAGTITTATANGFADWPDYGWCRIADSGGTLREIVYYTSRTATSLTVPSGGRALLGTSAAAGAATDTVNAIPGFRIGKETADSDNRIQVIANETTAPSGITWTTGITSATGLTHTTLVSNQNLGLWAHLEKPSVAIPSLRIEAVIHVEFTVGGATYTNRLAQQYSIRDSTYARYELYRGTDADPAFSAATATSATLPFTNSLTPPGSGTREYRYTVRYRNAFNLVSLNNYYRSTTIDNTGAVVGSDLSSPQAISITNVGSGKFRLFAAYPVEMDADPADEWIIYLTLDGTDPDPDVDTPIALGDIGEPNMTTRMAYINVITDEFDWNVELRAIIRVRRSSDNAESNNTGIVTATTDTGAPPVRTLLPSAGEAYFINPAQAIGETQHSASPLVKTITGYGQTIFQVVSTLVWRAIVNDTASGRLFLNNSVALANVSISGSGTGSIEVVDANTIYFNVDGTRRAKLDLSAGRFEAAQFVYNGTIDDNPNTGPVDTDNGKLYLSVYNKSRSAWQPYMQIDSTGKVTFGVPIVERDT